MNITHPLHFHWWMIWKDAWLTGALRSNNRFVRPVEHSVSLGNESTVALVASQVAPVEEASLMTAGLLKVDLKPKWTVGLLDEAPVVYLNSEMVYEVGAQAASWRAEREAGAARAMAGRRKEVRVAKCILMLMKEVSFSGIVGGTVGVDANASVD